MLPAARNDRVSVIHQETVADVGGLVTGSAFVEVAVHDPVAAVVDLVGQHAVAPGHVHRLEDVHVEGVFDEAGGIPRRLVQIDNLGVQRGAWIDHRPRPADQNFIRADRSKGLSAKCSTAARDLEVRDARGEPAGW